MRRPLVVVTLLGVTALGVLSCRYQNAVAQERALLAKIESLCGQRASQEAVEGELGLPAQKHKATRCTDEWIYIVAADRRAFLCFDDLHRAASVKIGRSFDRQDY